MYSHIAASYNKLHQDEQHRKLRALLDHVDLDEISSVLDVGCATAHCAQFFTTKSYVGVDPTQELLDHAPANINTHCQRGEKLNVPPADLVLSLTALHNYTDPIKGVSELHRVTKKVLCVGILRKSSEHDTIYQNLKRLFYIKNEILDQHDTLLVCIPKE